MAIMLGSSRSSMAEILHARVNNLNGKSAGCKIVRKCLSGADDPIVKYRFPVVLCKPYEKVSSCQLANSKLLHAKKKNQGGLGILDLDIMNIALLDK
jgi:hypothetical protein